MDPKERFEQEKTKAGELCNALLRKDEKEVFRLLEEINDFLIGERGNFSLPAEYKDDIRRFMNSESSIVKIHLGDGGISRLILSKSKNRISIDMGMGSSDEVNRKWEEIK